MIFEEYEEEYEEEFDEIREKNKVYLDLFEKDLINAGLKENTIYKHLSNVNFYINDYLLREDALEIDSGAFNIDGFLGDYFIRKCMWSTPSTIKSTAASIKKFYKSMLEHGHVCEADYDFLAYTIKDNIYDWMDLCEIYNDPTQTNPFFYF